LRATINKQREARNENQTARSIVIRFAAICSHSLLLVAGFVINKTIQQFINKQQNIQQLNNLTIPLY